MPFMMGILMKTLKEVAQALGIHPKRLQRRVTAGVVTATRDPRRGYLLDDKTVALVTALFSNSKPSAVAVKSVAASVQSPKRKEAVPTTPRPQHEAHKAQIKGLEEPQSKEAVQAMSHPQEEAYKAQIKGLEMLVAAHQAQVTDLQTRLTAAETTIRACALMAPAAAMAR